MTITHHRVDGFTISALVTDGRHEWLESQRYIGYGKREATRLFRQHVKANKWKLV